MTDGLYGERPALYDAIQSDWNYDRDIAFVVDRLAERGVDGDRLLDVGCGTGEHARRFADRGVAVTAIDKHGEMLDRAREKCDGDRPGAVDFREATLPDLDLDGPYDAIVAVRGVINHLPPADLAPALVALRDRLADGGLLVFDNSPLPSDGNRPGLDVGTVDGDRYARVSRHVSTEGGRLDWRSVTFTPDEVFTDRRRMTPFSDDEVAAALEAAGFDAHTAAGYGPDDDRTVFVAVG